MNFKEWASQTAKLLPVRYNKEIVEEVLYAAIKAAIEEFMTNPAEADLALMGVGRFYMNRTKRNNIPVAYREKSVAEVKLKWQVIFRPSRMFKELLNGLKEVKDYRIVNRYLFPEYHYGETTQFGLVVQPTKSLEIMHSNDYWIKRIQGIVDGKLELKSDGSIGKKTVKKWQPPETRGRKRKRLTPAQVRTEVMTLMRRDLRRELRHYRQGKITEEDFVYARFGCKKEISEIRREKKKAENKIIREKREKELAKEKAKERKLAQIEKEKAQKQAQRELEKEKAQKKALREKEREKAQKAKEREAEREKKQRAIEREKERAKAQKNALKEKEQERVQRAKEAEKRRKERKRETAKREKERLRIKKALQRNNGEQVWEQLTIDSYTKESQPESTSRDDECEQVNNQQVGERQDLSSDQLYLQDSGTVGSEP